MYQIIYIDTSFTSRVPPGCVIKCRNKGSGVKYARLDKFAAE